MDKSEGCLGAFSAPSASKWAHSQNCLAHKLKVGGSNPAATTTIEALNTRKIQMQVTAAACPRNQ